MALLFTASDMLHTYRTKRTIDTPELNQIRKSHRRQPIIYFGMTWYFNKQQDGQEKGLEFEGGGVVK